MDFTEPVMVQQALDTHESEVEAMYWILEDALHSGRPKKAHALLNLLLYVAKFNPELIQTGLKAPYRKRLRQITYEILDQRSFQKVEAITVRAPISSQKLPFKKEKELQNYLANHPEILCNALDDKIFIYGTEVVTEDKYRCDIVAESSSHLYPIELKIVQGTHAVVSQCSKYCYYFYRQMRYDRFKNIQGAIISSGFDSWSINELRRLGHWIYHIVPNSETEITLKRVE